MKQFLRENGLGLFFAGLFASTVGAQSLVGQHAATAERLEHGESAVSWWEYVSSVDFWGAVMENWQSEFLQFTVFIGATIWLVQKGSAESKPLDEAGSEGDDKAQVGEHAQSDSAARPAPGSSTPALRELAPPGDGHHLPLELGRPVAEQLAELQRRAARS